MNHQRGDVGYYLPVSCSYCVVSCSVLVKHASKVSHMATNNAGDWFPSKYGTGIPDTNPILPRYMGLDAGGSEMVNTPFPCTITYPIVNDWFVVDWGHGYTSAFRLSEVVMWEVNSLGLSSMDVGVTVTLKNGKTFILKCEWESVADEKGETKSVPKVTDKQREFFARLGVPSPLEKEST